MSRGLRWSASVVALLIGLPTGAARADDTVKDPKFEHKLAKPEELKDVKAREWKAQAKLGGLLTTGNSQAGSISLGGNVSLKAGMNKFALEASWAYARSNVLSTTDVNNNGAIEQGEIFRQDTVTTNLWQAKARYDRFFSENNSAYLAGLLAGDTPGGKELLGGGQIGYSRVLYKNARHEAVAEIGYDFSYESYVGKTDSVAIHSLRLFTGYKLKITDATGVFASFEGIFNLNTETVPTEDKTNEAGAFKDTRLNGKIGASMTLWKKLSVSVSCSLKYDNTPAPRGAFKIPFAAGFVPLSDKLDTITEAALIYTFL
jgi:hypothetical protein